jgi:chemotaxis signal transduction protein
MKTKSGDTLKFVTFDVVLTPKPITMALNVQKIKEVVEVSEMSTFPDTTGNTLGIHDLRGTPIPIFDVLRVLSKGTRESELKAGVRILICDLQRCLIGFPVARTKRTISCNNASFLPPPRGGEVNGRKIVSGLVRRDDGYIAVLDLDSILELIDPEISREEPGSAPTSWAGKRVLIAEDSKTILKKLVQLFSEMKFDITTVTNGADGLEAVKKSPSPFDLIFTDIEMPFLDGTSMIREIKKVAGYQNVPVLFNSALSNPALISDIEEEQLGRYIVKYDRQLIFSEVSKAMTTPEKKTA